MPRREATCRAMGLEKRVRKPQKLPWADPARLALTHHPGSSIAAPAPTQRGHRTRSHSSCSPITPGSGSPRSFPGAGGAPTSPPCHRAPPRDVTSLLPPPTPQHPLPSPRSPRGGDGDIRWLRGTRQQETPPGPPNLQLPDAWEALGTPGCSHGDVPSSWGNIRAYRQGRARPFGETPVIWGDPLCPSHPGGGSPQASSCRKGGT